MKFIDRNYQAKQYAEIKGEGKSDLENDLLD
jgi:hypothetical protein